MITTNKVYLLEGVQPFLLECCSKRAHFVARTSSCTYTATTWKELTKIGSWWLRHQRFRSVANVSKSSFPRSPPVVARIRWSTKRNGSFRRARISLGLPIRFTYTCICIRLRNGKSRACGRYEFPCALAIRGSIRAAVAIALSRFRLTLDFNFFFFSRLQRFFITILPQTRPNLNRDPTNALLSMSPRS